MNSNVVYAGYRSGALANVLRLHADYYHEHWSFGVSFEVKLARELAEFLDRMDEKHDLFLAAYSSNNRLLGSITIDAKEFERLGAHLRWFIVSPESTRQGIGQELISRALEHCDRLKFEKVYLTTFEGLDSARSIYDRWGFYLESVQVKDQWNGGVTEQKFVRLLPG